VLIQRVWWLLGSDERYLGPGCVVLLSYLGKGWVGDGSVSVAFGLWGRGDLGRFDGEFGESKRGERLLQRCEYLYQAVLCF
jgi:hypothetical protein